MEKIYKEFVAEFDDLLKEVAKLYKVRKLRDCERLFTKTQCGGPLRPRKMVANLYDSYHIKHGNDNNIISKFRELSVIAEKYDDYSYYLVPHLKQIYYIPTIVTGI